MPVARGELLLWVRGSAARCLVQRLAAAASGTAWHGTGVSRAALPHSLARAPPRSLACATLTPPHLPQLAPCLAQHFDKEFPKTLPEGTYTEEASPRLGGAPACPPACSPACWPPVVRGSSCSRPRASHTIRPALPPAAAAAAAACSPPRPAAGCLPR